MRGRFRWERACCHADLRRSLNGDVHATVRARDEVQLHAFQLPGYAGLEGLGVYVRGLDPVVHQQVRLVGRGGAGERKPRRQAEQGQRSK